MWEAAAQRLSSATSAPRFDTPRQTQIELRAASSLGQPRPASASLGQLAGVLAGLGHTGLGFHMGPHLAQLVLRGVLVLHEIVVVAHRQGGMLWPDRARARHHRTRKTAREGAAQTVSGAGASCASGSVTPACHAVVAALAAAASAAASAAPVGEGHVVFEIATIVTVVVTLFTSTCPLQLMDNAFEQTLWRQRLRAERKVDPSDQVIVTHGEVSKPSAPSWQGPPKTFPKRDQAGNFRALIVRNSGPRCAGTRYNIMHEELDTHHKA